MADSVTALGWRSFGASVIGPGHVATGKPNQDAWASFHHPWGDAVVVSDGLGSKPHSDWGSAAVCRAVEFAASNHFQSSVAASQPESLVRQIRDEWITAVAPLSPRDSAATCVFAIADRAGKVHLGLLGDGAVVAVLRDGLIKALTDDKADGFSNMTSALSPNVDAQHWQLSSVPATDCVAVVLSTDGVSDDIEDLEGFARGFATSFAGLADVVASRRIREMLSSWPVPKHSDDKTLACLMRKAPTDA